MDTEGQMRLPASLWGNTCFLPQLNNAQIHQASSHKHTHAPGLKQNMKIIAGKELQDDCRLVPNFLQQIFFIQSIRYLYH